MADRDSSYLTIQHALRLTEEPLATGVVCQERDGQTGMPLEHRCTAISLDQVVEVRAISFCPLAGLGERSEREEIVVGSCRLDGALVGLIQGPSRRILAPCGGARPRRSGGFQRGRPLPGGIGRGKEGS